MKLWHEVIFWTVAIAAAFLTAYAVVWMVQQFQNVDWYQP